MLFCEFSNLYDIDTASVSVVLFPEWPQFHCTGSNFISAADDRGCCSMQLPRDEMLSTFDDKIDMIRYDLFHNQCIFLKNVQLMIETAALCISSQ